MRVTTDKIHRDLSLTTPLTHGPDVKALQQALNKIPNQYAQLVDFKLAEDGKLGELTHHATIKAAFILGLARPRLNEIEKRHLIAQPVQLIVRDRRTRSDEEKKIGEKRRKALRKKLDRRPSLKDVRVTRRPGEPHWGGSNDVVAQYVEPFMVKRGLPIGSGKRTPSQNEAVDGAEGSDHLTTKRTTMARDFPTLTGEDDARALTASMGFGSWRPNRFDGFTFSAGGHNWRGQVLWGAAIDHDDHVHVGIEPA